MLENRDYCDYDTCVALRELGYDAPQRLLVDYFGVYDGPQYDERIHLYEAQKWLREEKGICVYPQYFGNTNEWIHTIYVKSQRRAIRNFHSTTYENSLLEGIKEAVKILKEKEFHNLRKAFYIDESIVWIPQGKSHKEYFNSINHSDFIETKVRGYILNDTLHLYKGSDFSIPTKKEVENIVSLFASFNIKQINLGCNIGNIGEVWKPKEIIKLLKEEE